MLECSLSEEAVQERIAEDIADDLVPQAGKRFLVDCAYHYDGPGSTIVKNFQKEHGPWWIPGEMAFDASAMALGKEAPDFMQLWSDSPWRWRRLLTVVLTNQTVHMSTWSLLAATPAWFHDPEGLRDHLRKVKEEIILPRTCAELATFLSMARPSAVTEVGAKPENVKRTSQLLDCLKSFGLQHDVYLSAVAKLTEVEAKKIYRLRFDTWMLENLLASGGMLESLAIMTAARAKELVLMDNVTAFAAAFEFAINLAGPLTALKTAGGLQQLGYLTKDGFCKLGEKEGAFCYIRAMSHNTLTSTDGPTWLKAKYTGKRKTVGADTMNALGYLMPTQAQVKSIANKVRYQRWETKAKMWWDGVKATNAGDCKRFDKHVKAGFLRARTGVQFEGYACEVGNRQKKARAGLRSKAKYIRKGKKDLRRAIFAYAHTNGTVIRCNWNGAVMTER